jgi:hypothetical protein
MMDGPGQAERWYAALETIIRRYRAGLISKTESTLTLEQALEATRPLGLTDGEALRYLQPPGKR